EEVNPDGVRDGADGGAAHRETDRLPAGLTHVAEKIGAQVFAGGAHLVDFIHAPTRGSPPGFQVRSGRCISPARQTRCTPAECKVCARDAKRKGSTASPTASIRPLAGSQSGASAPRSAIG